MFTSSIEQEKKGRLRGQSASLLHLSIGTACALQALRKEHNKDWEIKALF
jgi:hypothetical protein